MVQFLFLGCVSLLEVCVIQSNDLASVSDSVHSLCVLWLTTAGAAQLNSTLLTISVIAVLLPVAFHFSTDASLSGEEDRMDILAVSHGVSRHLETQSRPVYSIVHLTGLCHTSCQYVT